MGATPQEEIDRQHKVAIDIVQNTTHPHHECTPMIPKPEIPLEWKLIPTMDDPHYINSSNNISSSNNEEDSDSINTNCDEKKEADVSQTDVSQYSAGSCIATRGVINADNIASLVQEGCHKTKPTTTTATTTTTAPPQSSKINLWDEDYAAKNNVDITRPSHDAWGIQKIILLFCDDFLQTVHELPYFHLPKYKELQNSLQPIYDVLNITPDRIVRMLFASLPPGVTIPIHHDTGEWVKHTHRIHVPIIVSNPNHILFRCGPTESIPSLQRINCKPGHIFEMNNQAKHAVSNCDITSRVHLILDYVDTKFQIKHRIKLKAGEQIIQSRRSIDRAIDAGNRQTPSYLILGVQKCGTTSIYEYMNQHPLIIRAKRRETHCFDWRWDSTLKTTKQQQKHCLSFFYSKELYNHPSLLTGDSTPSYLLDSYRVIPRIKKVLCVNQHWKQLKFIIILRNPTKRVKSHYEMVTSLDGTEAQIQTRGIEWLHKSIEDVIDIDIQNMKTCGLIPYWDVEKKIVDMDVFHSFANTKEEENAFYLYLKDYVKLHTGSYSILGRGLYELQLRRWMKAFDKKQFLVLKLESMSSGGGGGSTQQTMDKVWKHINVPYYQIKDEKAKNTRTYKDDMCQETKDMLDRFFKPHNERLALMLSASTSTGTDDKEWDIGGTPWK